MINYFNNIIKTIQESFKSLDEDVFELLIEECVSKISSGGKIVASGLGKNVPICEKFVGTLNSLGISAQFLHTNTAMHGDLGAIKEKDVVILLTKSGNTSESLLLAEHLIKREMDIWLISFNKSSQLTKVIKKRLILNLPDEGDGWNIIPNNSTSVYLILLQGLAIMIRDRLEIQLDAFKLNHPGGNIGNILRSE